MMRIGASAGLVLRKVGGFGMSLGNCPPAALIASSTSLAARVDVAGQVELQGDLAGAGHVDRGHLRQAGDLAELGLERRGDRGRHGVRAGAGILRGDGDRREFDGGQRGDRQERVGGQAGQEDGGDDQRGRDRAPDEGAGDAHFWAALLRLAPAPAACPAVVGRDLGPGARSRVWPDDDHLGAGVEALGQHGCGCRRRRPAARSCRSTVLSGLTANTNSPSCAVLDGGVRDGDALGDVSTCRRTLTNWPGVSASRPRWGSSALQLDGARGGIDGVVGGQQRAGRELRGCVGLSASTGSWPLSWAARICGKIGLRQAEQDGDRLVLHDGDDARPVLLAWIRLPGSTRRRPIRPSIGDFSTQ